MQYWRITFLTLGFTLYPSNTNRTVTLTIHTINETNRWLATTRKILSHFFSSQALNQITPQNVFKSTKHDVKKAAKNHIISWLELYQLFTVPKFGISQSEALFTVLISYDIKSLTWYPTISWTVCKICMLLLALEMKITKEIQRNVKQVHRLKEKAICLTPKEQNKLHFRAKIGRGALARDTTHEFLQSLS